MDKFKIRAIEITNESLIPVIDDQGEHLVPDLSKLENLIATALREARKEQAEEMFDTILNKGTASEGFRNMPGFRIVEAIRAQIGEEGK